MKNKLILLSFLLLFIPFQYSYSEVDKVGLICRCKNNCRDIVDVGFSKFRNYYFDEDGRLSSLGIWFENDEVIETNFIMGQNDNILKDIFEHFEYPIQTSKSDIFWENKVKKLFSTDEGTKIFSIQNKIFRETLILIRRESVFQNNKKDDSQSYDIVYECGSTIRSKREYEKRLDRLQKLYQSEYDEIIKKNKI